MFSLSVRARLALWYAAAFAVLLAVMATGAYLFLAQTTAARLDGYLAETADATADALATALAEGDGTAADSARVAAVLRDFRFREIGVAVFDAGVAGPQRRAPAPPSPRPTRRGTKQRPPRKAPVTIAAPPVDPNRPPPFTLVGPLTLGRRAHLFGGSDSVGQRLAAAVAQRAARRGAAVMETIDAGDDDERVLATPVAAGGRALVVGVSQSLREQVGALDEARTALLFGLPLALLLATAGGYVLARRSLQPVDEMAARAAHIGATTLHERLPVAADDELGRLAGTFNALLGRLDESFQRQRQFMADVSHELRTPVAIVRGEAELALARPERGVGEYREALGTISHEATRLTQVVNDLFLLARADAGDRPLERTRLYLEELVSDCVASVRTLAARKDVAISFSPEEEVEFTGDEKLLRRMLVNLLDNAIKYTPAGGTVSVALTGGRDGETRRARITVRDTGPGIPPDAQARIFDRFYRVQRTGTGGVGDASGAGLGLPIAAWVAQSHGGRLELVETSDTGTVFAAELTTSAAEG